MSLEHLIIKMREQNASSMHMSAGLPPLFNVNGKLIPLEQESLNNEDIKTLANSLMNDYQAEKFKKFSSVNFTRELGAQGRQRISFYKQKGNTNALFRPISEKVPGIDELGLPGQIKKFADLHSGLVLVCGPAGCGKSTTVAALLNQINRERCAHIITLEEPIEYLFLNERSLFSQREIGVDSYSYANALREAIRQDADIIMVGEITDPETIKTALMAAETGILVLGTMHTTDSVQTINRIISSFPSTQQQQVRTQLALILKAIVCQQLVMKADGSGRVVAAEIMSSNSAIKNLIREQRTHQIYSIIENSSDSGMQTMDQSLQKLYSEKAITDIELLMNALKPDEMQKKIQKTDIPTTQTTSEADSVDAGEEMLNIDNKIVLYKANFTAGQEGYWTSSVAVLFQDPGMVISVAGPHRPQRIYVSDFNIVSKKLRPFFLGKKILVRFKAQKDESSEAEISGNMMLQVKLFTHTEENSAASYTRLNLNYPLKADNKWHTYVMPLPFDASGKMLKITMLEFPICLTKIFISDIMYF